MTLTINGRNHEVPGENLTVSRLIDTLGLGARPVLVELNGEAVLCREFDTQAVGAGDTVEIIRMVAGG
jgi:sulfur carrier protein